MANRLNGFLENIFNGATNPKGNLGDYQHANRLYIADSFRLAPKQKFLYHVCFNINPAIDGVANFSQKHGREINMLVKDVELPSYNMNTEQVKQYNRRKIIHTGINYDPCKITIHDDNFGLTTLLWQAYYRYYIADGNHATTDGASKIEDTNPAYSHNNYFKGEDANKFRYGLDNGSFDPFFSSIQIFQLARGQYQAYTLVNPKISRWTHDRMDSADSQGIVESSMDIEYETVWYSSGPIETDNAPKGFASGDHYDTTPSPLSIEGGGTTSVFGQGGVAGGLTGVFRALNDPSTYQDPKKFLGTLLKANNTYKNAKGLTLEGIRNEGLGILTGALNSAIKGENTGLGDIAFPKGVSSVDIGLIGSAYTAIKTGNPEELVGYLDKNPAILESVTQKKYAQDTNKGPTESLQEYNSLPANAKENARQNVKDSIRNGDQKTSQMVSAAKAQAESGSF